MKKTSIVRSLVIAAGLCAASVSSPAPARAATVDGVMQSLDGSRIVVDGTSHSLDRSTRFEITQGRKIEPATIAPGTTVRLEIDDGTGLVRAVRPMVMR